MRGRKHALAILVISAAICSLGGTSAFAGHGAVSDILSFRNVYLPDAPVCQEVAAGLDQVTDRAVKDGYPIKVAIIASEADLSGADQYFGRPQDYARLLGSQFGFYHPGRAGAETKDSLLVVMPAGFGFIRSGRAANVGLVIIGLTAPKGKEPTDLARAGIGAVRDLADAAGHPVPAPDISGCGGGGTSALVYGVPIALLVLAAGVFVVVRRRRVKT
jgi:hypothetical protein